MHKSDQPLYGEVMENCAPGASVMALPRRHLLRLAEEIAMLNSMTRLVEEVCPRCPSTMRATQAA